ncbi:Flp family type IVb pilin [Sphingomonas qomolangmaensis]|uniref:Flp family type IVb pilin n=1 Tax=Sphingomonas qomolangmaensis TaxID=2918765 RepID=A0ABY5L6I9_9SPHN|nr:Flp family type IVb pilin [Sphingomonas qomolangmaensis]UUL81284.1 Flp family type IVb pilin [Sphingomonas qomolangmaensis]
MRRILHVAKRLFDDRRGATAVEYGLILALVFLAIVGAIAGVADATITMWDGVSTDVEDATSGQAE